MYRLNSARCYCWKLRELWTAYSMALTGICTCSADGLQASIQEAKQTLEQIGKLHLNEPKAPSGGGGDSMTGAQSAADGAGFTDSSAATTSGTGGTTGALSMGPTTATANVDAAASPASGIAGATGGPPPFAEALAPIADDTVPPPPADPTRKDGASAGDAGARHRRSGCTAGHAVPKY